MKAFAVALVTSLSLLGAARAPAADLPLPGGAPFPPSSYYPVSQPVNWGGVYIGLNGGYAHPLRCQLQVQLVNAGRVERRIADCGLQTCGIDIDGGGGRALARE